MSVSLTVVELCKRFAQRVVLKDLSFRVMKGDCLVITGPNGSGKTTLIRILAGLTAPSSGVVNLQLNGRVLDLEERRREVGLTTPEVHLYSELTPLENLRFFYTVRGLAWDETTTQEWLRLFGLQSRQNDLVGELSSGMKQRLKLISAIAPQPSLLLLDEPGTNLDEEGRGLLRWLVERQRTHGITVITSNDQKELALGDDVLTLGK